MEPANLVRSRISVDGTFEEEVDAFLEVAGVQGTAEGEVNERLICRRIKTQCKTRSGCDRDRRR